MVFYLKDQRLDKTCIHSLAQKALCPLMLCHEVDECIWDLESRVLTTKADTVEQEEGERMEKRLGIRTNMGPICKTTLRRVGKNMQHLRLSITLTVKIPSRHFMIEMAQDTLAPLVLRLSTSVTRRLCMSILRRMI